MSRAWAGWENLSEAEIAVLQARSRGIPPVPLIATPETKTTKYRNRKTGTADSVSESTRAQDLALMERAGVIRDLCVEKRLLRYALVVSSRHCPDGFFMGYYTADARYVELPSGTVVVEDTKSPQTRQLPAYSLRIKLMVVCHGIYVREYTKPRR